MTDKYRRYQGYKRTRRKLFGQWATNTSKVFQDWICLVTSQFTNLFYCETLHYNQSYLDSWQNCRFSTYFLRLRNKTNAPNRTPIQTSDRMTLLKVWFFSLTSFLGGKISLPATDFIPMGQKLNIWGQKTHVNSDICLLWPKVLATSHTLLLGW